MNLDDLLEELKDDADLSHQKTSKVKLVLMPNFGNNKSDKTYDNNNQWDMELFISKKVTFQHAASKFSKADNP